MSKRIILIVLLLLFMLIVFLFYPFHGASKTEVPLVLEDVVVDEEIVQDTEPQIGITAIIPELSDIVIVPVSPIVPNIKFDVPFTPQAPFAEWSDLRQQDACEEASVLMTIYWAKGLNLSPQEAKDKILAISDWETETYGSFQDTSAKDTAERIFKRYFEYEKVDVIDKITIQDIVDKLEKESLIIVPADGRALNNRFFQTPGPERHMLVIIGYNYDTKEFITNDPGTKNGQGYVYDEDVLFNAIRDYPTGSHEPIVGIQKSMIVVQK